MPQSPQDALTELKQKSRTITLLASCGSLLGWDERTYMPPGGAEHRSEQLALIAGMSHERLIDPRIGELIDTIKASDLMNGGRSDAAAIVRDTERIHRRARRIPQSLVEEIAKATSLGQHAWEQARAKSDYAIFKPWLVKIIDLKRQEADAVGYEKDRYDALLDDFEPGATVASIEKILTKLRVELVALLDKIMGSSRRPDTGLLTRKYPIDQQREFGLMAATEIGFDFKHGRLDVTVHPFCTGIGPGDTRLTTRYDEHNFVYSFFSVVHEAGHGIYDQGLDPAQFGNPLGEYISLGIHESQSRMWENMVGRSRPFWSYFFPKAKAAFPEALGDVSLDQFYFAVNDVKPSFIRTEADEATYNLHILLRFELERAIFSGDLKVDDVPAVWNERFKSYLGLTPANDAQGCLQDVHWSAGLIGYFPTYSLGNLYAAQFFEKARQDLGDLDAMFARGEYIPLRDWLRQTIHRQGRRYLASELVERVTGKPLGTEALIRYMTAKFGALYGF